jgi:hypothetical protein
MTEKTVTPMQRELNEARKDRLRRMNAWHPTNVVPLDRIAQREPSSTPAIKPMPETKPLGLAQTKGNAVPIIKEDETLRIHQIKHAVAMRYRITLAAINSDSKGPFVTLPRQIAYTLARRLTVMSLAKIAREFGRRDHTTIRHGVQRMEERASHDTVFAAELEQLEQVIVGKSNLPCPCCGKVSGGSSDQPAA